MHRMGNTPTIVSNVENKKIFNPILYFCKLFKITLEFISELINMNYSFNIPIKFSLKTTKEFLLNSMMVYFVENFTDT